MNLRDVHPVSSGTEKIVNPLRKKRGFYKKATSRPMQSGREAGQKVFPSPEEKELP